MEWIKSFLLVVVLIVNVNSYSKAPVPKYTAIKKCQAIYASKNLAELGFVEPTEKGGVLAEENEFPYMVAVGRKDASGKIDYKCGGVLISSNYVVAPAHCALFNSRGDPANVVLLGKVQLDKNNPSTAEVPIKRNVIHPNYKKSEVLNDIALIELQSSVLNRPACLWSASDVNQSDTTSIYYDLSASPKSNLFKVKNIIITNEQCAEIYRDHITKGIVDSQICAAIVKLSDCLNTASGPLLIQGLEPGQIPPHVIGLSSFGRTCTDIIFPSVYTRISSYINWIESIVWPNE